MTDNDNPQIYPIDEQDDDEPSDDVIELVNVAGGGGSELFNVSNGTATRSSTADEFDMRGADIESVGKFDYKVAVDTLGDAEYGTTTTIDVSEKSVWELEPEGSTTIEFVGAEDEGVYSATVFIDHDAEDISFASDVTFDDDGAPEFTDPGEVAVSVFTRDGGQTWLAMTGGVWS